MVVLLSSFLFFPFRFEREDRGVVSTISVERYYKETYDIRLRNPNAELLIVKRGRRELLLPAEVWGKDFQQMNLTVYHRVYLSVYVRLYFRVLGFILGGGLCNCQVAHRCHC